MTEPTNEQLAEWIEQGLQDPRVEEAHNAYFMATNEPGLCRVCALSIALIGKVGFEEAERRCTSRSLGVNMYARELGVSFDRANAIEDAHLGETKAAEIAAMLRRGEI